ncbi:MAG: GTPase HflX [Elusimicrobiota bacterium]|jgi:GTP-binding protein HflX|nr:GTPase HflX [Elusimicrobiota bacterium]
MERTILVGVKLKTDFSKDTSLDELVRLCNTAGGEVISVYNVRVEKFNAAYFIGKGKTQEIAQEVLEEDIDAVIFNDEITPAQQKNLEEIIPCKIIDRTRLILDIFAQRARTKEGELQVELAQLNYLLPRLSGKGSAMMQQKGGIGMRGPGERKLECDRRRIRQKIAKLEGEIEAVQKERKVRRARRGEIPLPQVAIAGYTNAGKSTLLNALTNYEAAYADDKLFATLDPTTRRVKLPNGAYILFTDTVGFIQKLPHSLVSAFRATLEETKFADVILHLIDASSDDIEAHSTTVHSIINELEASPISMLDVFNKIDSLTPQKLAALRRRFKDAVFISAATGEGFGELFKKVNQIISRKWKEHRLKIPQSKANLLPLLYSRALITGRKDNAQDILIKFLATDGNFKAILKKLED